MERVVAIVQARVGSSRLPGKSLRPMQGRPMVLHVLDRVKAAGFDDVWLATSLTEPDARLADVAREAGYWVHTGSEWDVLGRIAEATHLACADVVVRVTGDCPLWAPDIGRRVVAHYRENGSAGITTNDTRYSGWPDGLDTEVFSAQLRAEANDKALDRRDREHVTPWMRRHAAHHVFRSSEDWRAVKLSVDSSEDFDRVARVMAGVSGGYEWTHVRESIRALSSTGGTR